MVDRKSHRGSFALEGLENRTLMSGSGCGFIGYPLGPGFGAFAHTGNTVQFNEVSTAIQAGLDAQATAAGLTPPAADSTQTVYLRNINGVELYTIDLNVASTDPTVLTVDQNGNAVAKPTKSTTTWGVLNGAGTGSNAAAAGEISKIFLAFGMTAPDDSAVVNVITDAAGNAIYTIVGRTPDPVPNSPIQLNFSISRPISVDANGNPVGFISVPFSTLPTAIQNGLNSNAPAGSTPLDPTATGQFVQVQTPNGITTYTAKYDVSGVSTPVTVDANGNLASLPSTSKSTFAAITSDAARNELQLIATDAGIGTIDPTQVVNVYDEANGTTIYSVTLTETTTTASGHTYSHPITISSDESGNPTVPSLGDFGFRLFGPGGPFGGHGFSGGFPLALGLLGNLFNFF